MPNIDYPQTDDHAPMELFSYQRVGLRDLVVQMGIGIAAWERKPGFRQRVIVNVDMYRRGGPFAADSIADCIDYNVVHEHISRQWPQRPHTDLLETLAEEVVALCFQDPKVEAVRVNLKKPDVYADTGAAMVEVFRRRQDPAS